MAVAPPRQPQYAAVASVAADRTLVEPLGRTFLRPGAAYGTWQELEPCFNALSEREIANAEDLHRWLQDLSELEAVLSEVGAWRYIRMSTNTADKDAARAYEAFVTEVLPSVEEHTDRLHRKLIAVPFLGDLDQGDYAVYFRGIREQLRIFREANVPIQAELRTMAQEYGAIIGAMSVEWRGETMTLPKASSILESPDRSEREQVYRLIAERRGRDSERLDTLFHDMVGKRHTIAVNAGFLNYRDYAYASLGRFDHDPKDALEFHHSVETEVVPLLEALQLRRKKTLGLDRLRPWDLHADPTGKPPLRPFTDEEELITRTCDVFDRLDPYFGGCLRTMKAMGRLDLASRKGKAPGGYNYPLYETGAPFIFMNAVGTADDVVTMVHEGGHAVHSFLTHPLPLTGFKNFPSEVAELASMGMELLSMDHWHLFHPDPEDLRRAKRDQLERVITILPWVATIDAFQHANYTHPEWSIVQRSQAWAETYHRFAGGAVDHEGLEAECARLWHKQLHVFELPFYYIEYAIAQLGAIGIWRNYRTDPKAAIADYSAALKLGYTRPLPDIYERAGVRLDLSRAYIAELVGFVRDEMERT